MKARRSDGNQSELVRQMRKIGLSVQILSGVGDNCPDLLVGTKGKNYLFEVKDPAKPPSQRKLRPGQETFFRTWQGQVHKVETIEDVIKIIQPCQ